MRRKGYTPWEDFGSYDRVAPPPIDPLSIPNMFAWDDFAGAYVTQALGVVSSVAPRFASIAHTLAPVGIAPTWTASSGSLAMPAITFTSASARLVASVATVAQAIDASQAYTVLSVVEWTGLIGPNSAAIVGINDGGSQWATLQGAVPPASGGLDRVWRATANAAGSWTINNGTRALAATNVPKLGVTRYTGTNVDSEVQGLASIALAANTRAPVCNAFWVGNNRETAIQVYAWQGFLYEILIYLRALTNLEIDTLQNGYFKAKYPALGLP